MFKSILRTLGLGVVSGAACAAGSWLWKNGLEEKADHVKQEIDNKKKDAKPKTEEN